MSLLGTSPGFRARYDRMCALLAARRSGVTLRDLSRAAALAQALEALPVDHDHIARLAEELGVDLGALEVAS